MFSWLSSLFSKPAAPLGLAEERRPPDEQQQIDRILELLRCEMTRPKDTRLRAMHPKSNGLVRAEFKVDPDLPAELRVGLFDEARTYKAWIRFSNAANALTSDRKRGARGLAIKLFDVGGEKLLEDEKSTHDFLFISHDVFPLGTAKEFADFFNSNRILFFLTHLRNLLTVIQASRRFASPLEIEWFSAAPYLFGTRAVKYALRPNVAGGKVPRNADHDYLREALEQQLAAKEFSLDFMLQFQTDPVKMPIENALKRWSQEESSFIKVATVVISPQAFNAPDQVEFGENISFNPWHCLPVHRPLGGINRASLDVMKLLSDSRLAENQVTRVEPTGTERF